MKKEQVKEIYNSTDIFKNKKQGRVNQITQNEKAIEANITQYKEKNILYGRFCIKYRTCYC